MRFIPIHFRLTRWTRLPTIDNQTKNEFCLENQSENKDMSDLVKTNVTNDGAKAPSTTSFLGVVIDTENGSSNPKINKALNKSFSLLDIMKFIEVTKFKINMTMFDYFWQVVVGNHSTLVSTMVLEWFGYDGEYKKQRQNFKKMLTNNEIYYNELSYKDVDHELYPRIQEEISTMAHCDVVKSKFLVMKPRDLKMAIMQLKTKNGHIIRDLKSSSSCTLSIRFISTIAKPKEK
jgi:hypothetical protein